jgi:hypothetical protein
VRSGLDKLRRRVGRPVRVPRSRPRRIGLLPRPRDPLLHAAEAGAAGGGAGAAVARPAAVTSIAALLASHILREGEVVLMVLKPSLWFIPFTTASFAAITALVGVAMAVIDHRLHDRSYLELVLFLIAGRLMWSILQWIGLLYVLTDMRVLRVIGVFNVDVFDCPLRKVVRTRLVSNAREKLAGVGSIEIIPKDEDMPTAIWQTIRKPAETHERLIAAINRAKQSGMGCE